jgi:hypothetical protein
MRSYKALILLPLLVLVTGCAAHYSNDAVQDPYGFFSGIWHGVIFFIALLATVISWTFSLVGISFLDSIELIGRPNTGIWYYVGFAMGLMSAGGSANR